MDRTRLKVVADPSLTLNTHTIRVSGRSGRFTVVLENVPSPDNPKTSWLACYSALAALRCARLPGALRHLNSLQNSAKSCRRVLTKRRKTHIISGSAGGVPERLKGADCKSVGLAPSKVRILPPPPTESRNSSTAATAEAESIVTNAWQAGVAQWQSRSLPSLRRGFDSLHPLQIEQRPCSSVVEHSLGKGEVTRSIRVMGTR